MHAVVVIIEILYHLDFSLLGALISLNPPPEYCNLRFEHTHTHTYIYIGI